MFATEVPIVVDHMTGCRVHVLRWCEWSVLAFAMTFMVESIDSRIWWRPAILGATQGLATACALLSPFVSTFPTVWWSVMVTAILLFSILFLRF
jgi:hypothetical protein